MLDQSSPLSEINLATLEPLLNTMVDRVAERLASGPPVQSMTFGELFNLYYDRHVEANCTESGKRNFRHFFSKHLPYWEAMEVHRITRGDVQAWVDELAAQSPSSAARTFNTVQAVINWGVKRELIPPITNPCKGVERPHLRARERFAMPAELARLAAALQEEPPKMRDFFWTCLHTGARKSNVLSMRWDEIDFDMRTWTIPQSKFKNGDTHVVPLVDAAMDILIRRRASKASPWVFPGRHVGHLRWTREAWRRVLNRAGIANLTVHDLRRTLASYMAINGANQYTIAKMLGHKDMRSTAIYARLDLSAVRRESERVSEKIQNLVAMPLQIEEYTAAGNALALTTATTNTTVNRLSSAQRAVIEGKIISVLLAGGYCKKHFYSKLGSQFPLDSFELNRILQGMVRRSLIQSYEDDRGKLRYALPMEADG